MWIVVYKSAKWLNCQTQYIGPFASHDAAYEAMCELPALGEGGVKMTQDLTAPSNAQAMIASQNVIAKNY